MCLAGSQPQKWKERIRLARFPRASRTENKEIASIHNKWHIFQNMIIALKVERQTAKYLCLPLKLDVIGGNLRWNETGRTITLQSNFQLSVKSNQGLLWFNSTSLCDWSRKLVSLSQPIKCKLKPFTTWSPAFSRAWGCLLVFLVLVLIGSKMHLPPFDFTTLSRKALLWNCHTVKFTRCNLRQLLHSTYLYPFFFLVLSPVFPNLPQIFVQPCISCTFNHWNFVFRQTVFQSWSLYFLLFSFMFENIWRSWREISFLGEGKGTV